MTPSDLTARAARSRCFTRVRNLPCRSWWLLFGPGGGTLPPPELAQLNAALNAKESFIRGSPVVEKMGDVLGSIRGAPVLTAAQTNAAVSSGLWLLDPDSSGREAIGFTRGHEDGKQRGKTSPPSRSHPSLTTSRWRARRARSPTRTTARRWREPGPEEDSVEPDLGFFRGSPGGPA